ncbi:MAG: xanthine dehydrogenase family protein molybdopterin-binding subunit [Bryobacteraceae bacterium]
MNSIQSVSRRGFLEGIFSTGALILGAQMLPEDLLAADVDNATWHPSVYLGINPDGTVIALTHRSEMGTGIRTSLPMVLADELEADWKHVRIEQGIGDKRYGDQNTDGSCSIRDFYTTFREAGASARLMLERAAAEKWKVPASECKAQMHQVVHKSGKKAGYGELAALAAKQAVPQKADIKLKTPAEFRYIGKEMPITDLDKILTGKAIFGQDARVPGMVFASVQRSPVYGGTLVSFDDTEAKKVKGVSGTVTIERFKGPHNFQALGGVAVIADNTWAAMQGRKKLQVKWNSGEHASFDSTAYKAELLATASKPQKVIRAVGNVDAEFAKGGKIVEASYYVPLLSHVPMEPPVAVADYKNGKVTVWTCTQNPQAVQDTVSAAVGIKPEDVTCNVTLLGGGFGRKSKPDYVAEAAIISKQLGKPAKVVWSREEDVQHDFYHSTGGMHLKAAIGANGKPTAWLQRSVFPSIGSTFDGVAEYGMDLEMGMGWIDPPFDIPNLQVENGPAKHHVRIGWMRSVANIYHAFAVQSFLDELAASANRDRVEYMLEMIGPGKKLDIKANMPYWNHNQSQEKFPFDTARLRRVIELAAEKSGWANKKPSKNRALGIAAHRSFLTYVATVVEIEIDDQGKLTIPEMTYAVDAGTVVNPDRVRAQFEGAGVFGTSIALMGEITAKNGAIVQSNFNDYPVARMPEAPKKVNVHIIPSTELPAGVGEPGVPTVAPAITSAIFAATGKRIRELPIRKTKLV